MSVAEYAKNVFKAKNEIVAKIGGPVPGVDLIEVYADALTEGGAPSLGMTTEEVFELVCTVATQRREKMAK